MLFAGLSILLIVNAVAPTAINEASAYGIATAAIGLFGVGVVFYVAAFALWTIASEAEPAPIAQFDIPVAVLVVALALVPLHWLAKGALAPLALYLFATAPKNSSLWRIALINSTIAAAFLFGALILTAFAEPLLLIDAALVKLVTGASGFGNVVSTTATPGSGVIDHIVVLAGCSSLRNVSQATILWASLTQLFQLPISKRLMIAGLLAMASVTILNTVRIAAIVRYPQHYDYLHTGTGAAMFGFVSLLACLAIIGTAIANEPKRRLA